MNKFTEKVDDLISARSSGSFMLEIQSGAFRFYPRDDEAKKAIWRIKESFDIKTDAESWKDVWSLYFHPSGENLCKVSIQT